MHNNATIDFDIKLKKMSSSEFLNKCGVIDIIKQAVENNPYNDRDVSSLSSLNLSSADKSLLWKEQCVINYPILYLASVYLHIYASKNNIKNFLFTTRDCCHWHRIYKKLFPDANVHYFDCSRIMFERATEHENTFYDDYIMKITNGDIEHSIYVDIHGTCKRMINYFKKRFNKIPFGFLLSSPHRTYKRFPSVTREQEKLGRFVNIVFDAKGSFCESLNYDSIGTLQNYDHNGAIRDVVEYNLELIKPYHNGMEYVINKTRPLNHIIRLKNLKQILLLTDKYINKMFISIINEKPTILKYTEHISKHNDNDNDNNDNDNNDNNNNSNNGIDIDDINDINDVKNLDMSKKAVKKETKSNNSNDNSNNSSSDSSDGSDSSDTNSSASNNTFKKLSIESIKRKEIKLCEIDHKKIHNKELIKCKYDQKTCYALLYPLATGIYYDKIKRRYYHGKHGKYIKRLPELKYDPIFDLNDIKETEQLTLNEFCKEIIQFTFFDDQKISPKFLGYSFDDTEDVHYGILIFEKPNCILGRILNDRNRSTLKKYYMRLMKLLHKNCKSVHGHININKIGIYLDEKHKVSYFVFLNCNKIINKNNCNDKTFRLLLLENWKTYENLFCESHNDDNSSKDSDSTNWSDTKSSDSNTTFSDSDSDSGKSSSSSDNSSINSDGK